MTTVEFTGRAERAVGDQLADMRQWLNEQGFQPSDLQARVLHARVTFTATFAQRADAERFMREFTER